MMRTHQIDRRQRGSGSNLFASYVLGVHPTLIGDDLGADVRGQFKRSLLNVGMSLFGPSRPLAAARQLRRVRRKPDINFGGLLLS
jgi:hypothetical protein